MGLGGLTPSVDLSDGAEWPRKVLHMNESRSRVRGSLVGRARPLTGPLAVSLARPLAKPLAVSLATHVRDSY